MKVKKWLLGLVTFAAMAVICAVCAGAQTYGDFNYSVLDDGTVNITDYNGSAEKVVIPDTIDGKSVTSIGYEAFYGCASLTSVTIPKSVTKISYNVFNGCTSLTAINVATENQNYVSVNGVLYNKDKTVLICYPAEKKDKNYKIPDSVTSIGGWAFGGCTSLKSITIPNSVTNIGWYAFSNCTSLTSITIPDGVTEIGSWAFIGCTSLTSITIPDSVTVIGGGAFSGCTSLTSITIPDGVTEIDGSAFEDCTSLTSITIPNGVTSIGSWAFSGCSSLKSITIPNGVTSIGYYAFSKCSNLTSITIPNGVKSIGNSAFYGCTSLTSITIPNSVTSIGDDAFYKCSNLTSITIPNGVKSIGNSAFYGCTSLTAINVNTGNKNYTSVNGVLFNKDKTELICYPAGKTDKSYNIPDSVTSIGEYAFDGCTSLASITILNGVTSIGGNTFSGCTSLISITIPDSVTSIGNDAFEGCTSLTSVTIPNSVTSIGNSAFNGCTSLTSITIPNSVTSIGDRAFSGCTSLTSITIPNSVTEIGDYAFYGCTNLTNITIPDSVTGIGDSAFSGCTSLTSITIPNDVTSIGVDAFSGCTSLASITIPDGVTRIGGSAFSGCTSLTAIDVEVGNNNYTSVNGVLFNKDKTELICYPARKKGNNYKIPDGVTWIGGGAFSGCSNLTSITIPNSVTYIPDDAFSGCTSLSSITIPDGVTSIGNLAFKDCTSLASVTIPSSVTETGYCAFSGCTSLTAINVATGNQNYVSVNGVLHNKDKTAIICYPAGKKDKNYKILDGVTWIGGGAFSGCTSLTSITIPDRVTSIGNDAFYGCTSLTSITIPNGVTSIGSSAFEGCTSLKSITIPDGVTEIGNSAFSGCSSLTSITIPNSVTSIGDRAFSGCTSLTSITIPNSVTRIGNYAFGYYYDNGYKKMDNFKVYCYSGTEGEKYAIDNGFDYVLLDKLPTLSKVTGVKLGGRAADALRINWSKNANADGYIVEMYQNGKWERVAKITNSNTTTYRKAGLKAGTVYKFRVKAYKMNDRTAVYSDYSATVAAMTNPSVMTGAKLGGRAADALRINWSKNASADGYIVEMYQGNKWVRVAKITSNSTTTFRKAGLSASTVYKFRVRAYKMSGSTALYGDYSATVTAMTNPSVMAGAKLGGRAADALRINWSKNASADGYIVEMYQGNKWVRVAKITNSNTTTFRKAGLKASSVYKFRVSAYKMSGKTALYGNYSATVTARTNPSIVKGVKIGGKAKDALRVNWTKNASAQGYIVEMYKGGKWVRVAKITNGNTTTYRKAGLAKNTTYKFRVCAYYMSGKTALYGNYGSVSGKTAAK